MAQTSRVDFLDGMRGLAILMVVCLHYFANIYEVPRSIFYNRYTPLHHGDFGVQLFFIISGYVIFMTLDKTPGFGGFMLRRWIRLFPAMLVATLFIAVASYFIPYRPGHIPRLIDLVPGLSFLGANVISTLTGIQTDGLERGFWSIYVEFRFYVIFGIFYYVLGKYRSFFAMVALSLVLLGLMQLSNFLGSANAERGQNLFGKMLIGHHLPWFLLGMHIYLYNFKKHIPLLLLIVGNAMAFNLDSGGAMFLTAAIPLLMYSAFNIAAVQNVFRNKIFLFFGFISYPLYLLNDSLGRGIISGLYARFGEKVPFELWSLVTLPVIMVPAWYLAKYIEPGMQKMLKQRLLGVVGAKLAPTPIKEG
jgi:peptidoglycan/LPS O-acetylase OafA/YrhL